MIRFTCTCGKLMTAPDSEAGKRGRCPKCGAAVAVPRPARAEPELELLEVGGPAASRPRAAAPLPSDPPQVRGAQVMCPACGTSYPGDVLLCIPCGIEIASGRPIGAGGPPPPPRLSRNLEDDTPFWRTTLGLFTSPAATIAALPARLERPGFAWKVVALYAASFVFVALAIPRQGAAERREMEGSRTVAADPEGPRWQPVLGFDAVRYQARVMEPREAVEPGSRAGFRIQVRDADRKSPADLALWLRFRTGRTTGEPSRMERGDAPGEYFLETRVPESPGRASALFEMQPAGAPGPGTDAGLLNHAFTLGDGGSETASRGFLVVFAIVGLLAALFSTLGTALHAALLKLAAKLLGDEGSFRTMFLALLYLTGFALATVALLSLLPPVAFVLGVIVVLAFSIVYNVRAVMAVFGQPGLKAFLTVVIAAIFNSILSTALSFMLGFAGLLALAGLAAARP
ncbi:MAG: hypothetical protein HYY18_04920 [Planctomycetes bacterium]|nr:hypothetical protein [Planctomycetota bacterium]